MSRDRTRVTESLTRAGLIALVLVVAALTVVTFVPRDPRPPAATLPATAQLGDQDEQRIVSLWLGDSYTAGTGAGSAARAESCLASEQMGWVCNLDAQGGTGFVADGKINNELFTPLPARLASTRAKKLADVIVIDAGRNDFGEPGVEVRKVIADYLGRVRQLWPAAEIVVILPYSISNDVASPHAAVLRAQAADISAIVIDPLGEGWITGNKPQLIDDDNRHPSPEGHQYIADQLVKDFRKLGLDDLPITDLRGARTLAAG